MRAFENIPRSYITQKNGFLLESITQQVIITHKEVRMANDSEDGNGLKFYTIGLKFYKIVVTLLNFFMKLLSNI